MLKTCIHTQMHPSNNRSRTSLKIQSNICKHSLQNMSHPLKQSPIAAGAFGRCLFYEFTWHFGENRHEELWFGFRLRQNTSSGWETTTDANFSAVEDEAYSPGRRGERREKNVWKTFGLQTEGCGMNTSGGKIKTSEKKRSSQRARESTSYVRFTDTVGGSSAYFPFLIYF